MTIITTDDTQCIGGKILVEENTSANIANALTTIGIDLEQKYNIEIDFEMTFQHNDLIVTYWLGEWDYIKFKQIAQNAYYENTRKYYRIFDFEGAPNFDEGSMERKILCDYFNL